MAKTYTGGRNLAGTWAKNSAAANLTYLDETANDAYRHMCSIKDWPFLEQPRTISTIASQQFYPAPYDCEKVISLNVLVGTITYVPKLSPSQEHWDQLNLSVFTSDIPEWYFVTGGNTGTGMQIGLWPKPASSSNTVTVRQKCRVIDLQFADYTTGTITTTAVSAGVTTVTGSGSSWGTNQAGLWLKITPTSAANTGDGVWYLVTGVPSATSLTLATAYGGSALAAASANYILGQLPLLPEAFHDTPWKKAAGTYWLKEDDTRSQFFLEQYDEDVKQMVRSWSAPGGDYVLDSGADPSIINPNLVIRL